MEKGTLGGQFYRDIVSPHHNNKAKAVPLYVMEELGGEEVQLLFIPDLGTRLG
jgi:hypothetical protein